MSHQSSKKAAPSTSPGVFVHPLPELSELAASLQAACNALHDFCKPEAAPQPDRQPGELRSYYIPPAVVKHEKELLALYRASNFYDLLGEAHILLNGMVKLLKNTHGQARVKGHVLVSVGTLLEQVTALLLRMMNVYKRWEIQENRAVLPGS